MRITQEFAERVVVYVAHNYNKPEFLHPYTLQAVAAEWAEVRTPQQVLRPSTGQAIMVTKATMELG